MQEDLPYRSPVREALKSEQPESIDERDLSTLVQVRDLLKHHLDSMSQFDTFDRNLTPDQLYLQVQSRQQAHALIEPIYQAVSEIVNKIYKQKK